MVEGKVGGSGCPHWQSCLFMLRKWLFHSGAKAPRRQRTKLPKAVVYWAEALEFLQVRGSSSPAFQGPWRSFFMSESESTVHWHRKLLSIRYCLKSNSNELKNYVNYPCIAHVWHTCILPYRWHSMSPPGK